MTGSPDDIGVFTIYDPATGQILMTVRGTRVVADANGSNIEGDYSALEYTIVDGIPVAIVPDPAEALASAKDSAISDVLAHGNAMMDRVVGPVFAYEVPSWPAKEAAALAFLGATATAADMDLLHREATRTGETVEALAPKIAARAAAFRVVAPEMTGVRRALQATLDAAATTGDVETARLTAIATIDAIETAIAT